MNDENLIFPRPGAQSFVWPTPFTQDRDRSFMFATVNDQESLTQQSDAEDCDINIIMKKYASGGVLPAVIQPALQGDFSHVTDFTSALNAVREAEEAFLQIPAKVRAEFGNDPQRFIEFATKRENLDKLREYGLAPPAPKSDDPPKE